MKPYKSMDSYNFFVSGWVKDLGSKVLHNYNRLVFARMSSISILSCQLTLHQTFNAAVPLDVSVMVVHFIRVTILKGPLKRH